MLGVEDPGQDGTGSVLDLEPDEADLESDESETDSGDGDVDLHGEDVVAIEAGVGEEQIPGEQVEEEEVHGLGKLVAEEVIVEYLGGGGQTTQDEEQVI